MKNEVTVPLSCHWQSEQMHLASWLPNKDPANLVWGRQSGWSERKADSERANCAGPWCQRWSRCQESQVLRTPEHRLTCSDPDMSKHWCGKHEGGQQKPRNCPGKWISGWGGARIPTEIMFSFLVYLMSSQSLLFPDEGYHYSSHLQVLCSPLPHLDFLNLWYILI